MADPDASPGYTVKKKFDESWKDSVNQEKSGAAPAHAQSHAPEPKNAPPQEPEHAREHAHDPEEEAGPAESGFSYLVSSLGMQALLALGEIPNPITQDQRADLPQALSLIDILS